MENIDRLFHEDIREKRRARGGQFVGKKSPRVLILPSYMEKGRGPPWWAVAPTLVWVNIETGEVYVNRWPVSEQYSKEDGGGDG